jgi:hypothetical protein
MTSARPPPPPGGSHSRDLESGDILCIQYGTRHFTDNQIASTQPAFPSSIADQEKIQDLS